MLSFSRRTLTFRRYSVKLVERVQTYSLMCYERECQASWYVCAYNIHVHDPSLPSSLYRKVTLMLFWHVYVDFFHTTITPRRLTSRISDHASGRGRRFYVDNGRGDHEEVEGYISSSMSQNVY
jgi:hypothetical protein